MIGREAIGIVLKAIFGSNPNTPIEREYAEELTRSVQSAVDSYNSASEKETKAAKTLASSVSNISQRLG